MLQYVLALPRPHPTIIVKKKIILLPTAIKVPLELNLKLFQELWSLLPYKYVTWSFGTVASIELSEVSASKLFHHSFYSWAVVPNCTVTCQGIGGFLPLIRSYSLAIIGWFWNSKVHNQTCYFTFLTSQFVLKLAI